MSARSIPVKKECSMSCDVMLYGINIMVEVPKMIDKKFCKDCKFFLEKEEGLYYCNHVRSKSTNLVTGQTIFTKCETMRLGGNLCGTPGFLYEEKKK
jgi:Zn finger protein HypA/HybF involved in hydrogenase expression